MFNLFKYNCKACLVEHADVIKKGNTAVGYVTFSSEEKVNEAILTYDNFSWEGKEIKVYRAGKYLFKYIFKIFLCINKIKISYIVKKKLN